MTKIASGHADMSKTLGYYAVFIILGLVVASLGPTLPGLADHTATQLNQISLLFTARSFGYLIGSLLGGRLYDRWPGHTIIGLSLGLMLTTLFLAPIISLLWLLAITLWLTGLAEGTTDVGGNTLLVWIHGRNVGPYMNALHFFFGIGAFISPIIIAQAVLLSGDITAAYWVLSLLILPVMLWMLWLPSPPIKEAPAKGQPGQINYLLVLLVAVFFMLYVGAEVSFGGWIYTYAVSLGLADETTAAYLTSAFWGALTLGRLVSIPIAMRVRPRTILYSDLSGGLVSVSLILLWPDSLAIIWLGTLGMGFSMASIFPITLSLAERRMTITGQITGWFFVGASSGAMLFPLLVGQFFEARGPQVTMLVVLFTLLAAFAVLIALIFISNRIVKDE